MLENLYEGLNARPKVYLSKGYFCEMYPTCVSSKPCEFILLVKFGQTVLLQELTFSNSSNCKYSVDMKFSFREGIKKNDFF